MPRGEEDLAGQGRGTAFEADRTVELGRIVEVIEDDQGVGATVEFLEGSTELMIGRLVECLGPQLSTDLGEPLSERFGGVDPEDAAGVVVLIAVDIFDGELGLADAPHAGKPGRPDADRLPRLQDGVQPVEVVGATDEVGVPGKRHEEGMGPPRLLPSPAGLAKIFESPLDRFEPGPVRALGPADEFARLFGYRAVATDLCVPLLR